MDRKQLIKEVRFVAKSVPHNLAWMRNHPERIDRRKAAEMRAYLLLMEYYAREERKSARLAGLTLVRSYALRILSPIIPHFKRLVNH